MGDSIGSRHIRIHHSYQPHGFAALRQLLINASVVAPEGAHADYSDVNKRVGQFSVRPRP